MGRLISVHIFFMLRDLSNISLGFRCHLLALVWQNVSGALTPQGLIIVSISAWLNLKQLWPFTFFFFLIFVQFIHLFEGMGDKELFCAFQDVPSGAALGELFFIYLFFIEKARLCLSRHDFSENRIILNPIFLLKNLECLVCGWGRCRRFRVLENCSLVSLKYLAICILHFEVCKINEIINHSLNIPFVAGWLEITDGFLQAGFNFALS